MRFVVLGAGLAGVTSAWELLRDGHQVIVVDRGSESANFSSYANAGLVAPGHAFACVCLRLAGFIPGHLLLEEMKGL